MVELTEILYEKQRHGVLVTLNRPEALKAFIDKRDAPFQPEPFGPGARKRNG